MPRGSHEDHLKNNGLCPNQTQTSPDFSRHHGHWAAVPSWLPWSSEPVAGAAPGMGLDPPEAASETALMFQIKGSKKVSLFSEPEIRINMALDQMNTLYKQERQSAACTVYHRRSRYGMIRFMTKMMLIWWWLEFRNFALVLRLLCDSPAQALSILRS